MLISVTLKDGSSDMTQIVISGFRRSRAALWADWRILLVYLIQSAFEGAMYTFTFMWTPAL